MFAGAATPSCRSTSRDPAGSSTIRTRSGQSVPPRPPRRGGLDRASTRSRSRTSARRRCSGSGDGTAGGAGDRLAGPANRGALPRARPRPDPRAHRARPRSVLLGDEARVAAPRARVARRARVRHGRQLARLEADGRRGARDRRDERLAHAARDRCGRSTGTTSCSRSSASTGRSCRGSSARRGGGEGELLGARIPISRDRRRPAGRALRSGLSRGGRGRRRPTAPAASCSCTPGTTLRRLRTDC